MRRSSAQPTSNHLQPTSSAHGGADWHQLDSSNFRPAPAISKPSFSPLSLQQFVARFPFTSLPPTPARLVLPRGVASSSQLHHLSRQSSPLFYINLTPPSTHSHQAQSLSIMPPPSLRPRQQNPGDLPILPATYRNTSNSLPPGAIAGIVLGAVLGTILLIVLIAWATDSQGTWGSPAATTEEIVVTNRPRHRHSHHHHHRHSGDYAHSRRSSRRASVVDEYRRHSRSRSRSFSPRRRTTTEIVEERVERRHPSPPPGPPPMSHRGSRPHVDRIIVESRSGSRAPPPPPPPPLHHHRVPGDDEVLVEEDGSLFSDETPPGRRGSGRRRSSGYRPVDPDRFGGGDYPRRPVGRRYS